LIPLEQPRTGKERLAFVVARDLATRANRIGIEPSNRREIDRRMMISPDRGFLFAEGELHLERPRSRPWNQAARWSLAVF